MKESKRSGPRPAERPNSVLPRQKAPSTPHTIYDFIDRVLVVCPRCSKQAIVPVHAEGTEAQLVCEGCGMAKTQPAKSTTVGNAIDPYFRIPLWLQAPFSGHTLRAHPLGRHGPQAGDRHDRAPARYEIFQGERVRKQIHRLGGSTLLRRRCDSRRSVFRDDQIVERGITQEPASRRRGERTGRRKAE